VVPGSAQAFTPPENRQALIIGIDRFEGSTRPNFGGAGDASDMSQTLLQNGFLPGRMRVLTDSGARAADIRAGLAWLVANSTPSTFTVFQYSGHVFQEAPREYVWPHDNEFISDLELAASFQRLQGRALIIFSGCEAAGFDERVSSPNRLFLASSQSNEKSYELQSARASVFMMYMVRKGMLAREADFNRDGRVSVQEGFQLAAQRAPGFTSQQAQGPQHPYIAGGDGQALFLDDPFPVPQLVAAQPARRQLCILFICIPV